MTVASRANRDFQFVVASEFDRSQRILFVTALNDDGWCPLCSRVPVEDSLGCLVKRITRQDKPSLDPGT
jgi:hypothetical protein